MRTLIATSAVSALLLATVPAYANPNIQKSTDIQVILDETVHEIKTVDPSGFGNGAGKPGKHHYGQSCHTVLPGR